MRRLGYAIVLAPLALLAACGDDTSGSGGSGGQGGDTSTSTTKSTSASMNTTGSMMTTTTASTGMSSSTGMNNCGNDEVDAGEECDGTDLDGETCASQGFLSGTLDCNSNCTFDTAGCLNEMCGNNAVEGMETCDGTDLDGQTCITLSFDGGTLACASNCGDFDTSACTTFSCGDGMITGMEQCDGANLGGATCASQGFDGGTLSCSAMNCSFVTTACLNENCTDAVDNDGDAMIDCLDTGSCATECADACATVPSIADPSTTNGTTTGHADDYTNTCSVAEGGNSGPEVVYQVVASQTGFMHLTLVSDVPDLAVAAFTNCPNTGTQLGCADVDFGAGIDTEKLSVAVTTGQVIHVMVDGYSDADAGPYTLTVASVAAPVCGDGFDDGAEACDDGNAVNGDGCDTNCTVSACGNGVCGGTETSCNCTADCPDAPLGCEACECGVFDAAAMCQCDDSCIQYGDCCGNETAVCGVDSVTFALTSGTDVAIPDGTYAGTLATMGCVTLNTPAIGTITSVNSVVLAIDHTWVGDLTLKLVSPSGTVITLMSLPGLLEPLDNGASDTPESSNLVQGFPITFIPTAVTSAEAMGATIGDTGNVCAPAPGGDGICQFIPNAGSAAAGTFNNLVGQPVNGNWQVCGGDSLNIDSGFIRNTTINMTISG